MATTSSPTFPRFLELPVELQRQVWNHAYDEIDAGILEIYVSGANYQDFYTLMGACELAMDVYMERLHEAYQAGRDGGD